MCHQWKMEFEKRETIVQPQTAAQGLNSLFEHAGSVKKGIVIINCFLQSSENSKIVNLLSTNLCAL